MPPKASFRRHILRDWPQAKVVLAWMAFGCSVLFYFSDWSPPWHHPNAVLQSSRVSAGDDEEIYTGSILFARADVDHCWERKFDNRTGAIWDKGFINCGTTASQAKGKNTNDSAADKRMRALQAYFNNR
jgi:hypothetical protein